MHVTKFTQGACGHMINHYERQAGDAVERSNEDIDRERTHLNYNLAAKDQPAKGYVYLKQRLDEVHHINRKDIVVMADWVVTAPAEIKDDPEKCRQFFECAYDFMKQKYSKASVVSAWVHMDETTPHLHFAFMPIVPDEKRGGMKLNAKALINRAELNRIHDQFQKKIDKELPFKCSLRNGSTKLGNRSVEELKEVKKQTDAIVEEASQKADDLICAAKNVQHEANEYERTVRQRATSKANRIIENAELQAEDVIRSAQRQASEIRDEASSEATYWKQAYQDLLNRIEGHLHNVVRFVLGKRWRWNKEEIDEGLADFEQAWLLDDEDLQKMKHSRLYDWDR